MMTHITGLQFRCPLCAHAHSLTHTQAVNYSRRGVECAALCSVSHSAAPPPHRLLPTAGSELYHESDTTVDVCVLVHAERDAVCSNSHTRQTPFETMQVFPSQASELPGLCMLGVCSLCVSMFGSRFGRNPVSCLQISVFVLSAHNFRYWMDFTCC